MQTVSVTPVASGWAVRTTSIDNELFFRSGAAAERAARRLADGFVRSGEAVEITVHLKDGSRAGRFVCAPAAKAAPDQRSLESA